MASRTLPFQHLSLRVPWHDTGYEGTICADPLRNSACLRLGRIAEERDDARETALAGVPWADLKAEDLPPCASERAGFMSHASRQVVKQHPYAAWNEVYRKFKPTTFQIPAFAADCVPFRWMLRSEAVSLAERLELPYEAQLEEAVDAEAKLNSPSWVQHEKNQRLLLDTFFSSLQPERSLCFVYAKETPLTEDHGRVLLGVGRTTSVAPTISYDQAGGGFGSVLWERVIGHTIRPSMEDGFLLPYHEILELEAQGACDARDHAVVIPDDLVVQFSYATEHVSHDAAVQLLLQLDRAVSGMSDLVSGSWAGSRAWLSERLAEVWEARGPCPGLGAALTAFGVTSGVLVAHMVQTQLADNEDPWPLVDSWLRDPAKEPALRGRIGPVTSKAWVALPDGRRALLRLLSRFDLTTEQATRFYQPTERGKAGIATTDEAIAQNP